MVLLLFLKIFVRFLFVIYIYIHSFCQSLVEISIKYSSLYNKFILLLSSLVLFIFSLQLTQSYSKQNTSLFEKQKKIAGEHAKH